MTDQTHEAAERAAEKIHDSLWDESFSVTTRMLKPERITAFTAIIEAAIREGKND